MSIIKDIITTIRCNDERDSALCEAFGLTGPGGFALREPDGRMMIWKNEKDSENDDGMRAIYRSTYPISDMEWSIVRNLAWIDDYDSM